MISVIVPIYNVEPYVRQCIESLLAQTGPETEILLIDDGSTDRSGVIAEEYKDGRIRVFHLQNSGLSAARNFGIEHARGDWLMFVDGDDYVRFGIGTFKDCWKQLEANPKVEIVACQGAHWLRYTGKAVIDTDPKYVEEALEKNPGLKNMYNEETGFSLGHFYIMNGTAEISGADGTVTRFEF